MSGMRQKLRFTAVLVVLLIILGTASYREQGKRQKLSFPESLDLVVVAVDGEQVTLREMAFYIAYEEGNMEDAAIIYNPDNTDEYWQLYINHTFLREQAKQTVVDMTIHDTLFYQMATAEKITLSEEEEQYLANDQQDFWSDLTEEQRARLVVDEETIDASMRKMALSQKYGVELEPLMLHITDLLGRFRNEALKDTCKRVGGDPARKLGAADRLIGSSLLCLEMGVTPAYIAVGAAGAVYRYLNETGTEQSYDAAKQVLREVSGLPDEHTLLKMIMQIYGLYLEGETVAAMRRYAQRVKTAGMHDVI